MGGEKLEYTIWHYIIGISGLLMGAETVYLCFFIIPTWGKTIILGAFLLISAILFLFVKTEMTYLMFTGMIAVLILLQMFAELVLSAEPIGQEPELLIFIFMSTWWLCLGYLIYWYLGFRKHLQRKRLIIIRALHGK